MLDPSKYPPAILNVSNRPLKYGFNKNFIYF
jgi:hypothetical protein